MRPTPLGSVGWTPALTLLLGLTLLPAADGLSGQDVELLGRIHGTRPPDAYFRERARDPQAFRFRRAWKARLLGAAAPGEGAALQGATPLGPRSSPVTGAFEIPLVLGLFSDSPQTPPFSRPRVQEEFFDGPNSRFQTVSEYYAEISGGRIQLPGLAFPWRRSALTAAEVAGGASGLNLGSSQVGQYIVDVLEALDDGSVDWGRFDNDGPDGLPNSGDDDGFVDVLAVMHPTHGAECDGNSSSNRIWSHRFSLAPWVGSTYQTATPSASGGFVHVDDYVIQPVRSCDQSTINEIGVFAHELGHAFGLPDLYDLKLQDGEHGAVGTWGLMASGSWGCGVFEPERPCHMGAWSKAVLGWVPVDEVPPNQDLGTVSLDPVEAGGRVLRLESGDGSGEYLLLENRQRIGFDGGLLEPGLLVWHVDPAVVQAGWASNSINIDPAHMGVWIRQADGLNDLAMDGGGRGDAGDPFPGSTGNTEFHAGSVPGAWSHAGEAMGVTLLDIALAGQRLDVRVVHGYRTLALEAPAASPGDPIFTVDGAGVPGASVQLPTAPFQERIVEAAAGIPVSDGVRTGFLGWTDLPDRIRTFATGLQDATLVAEYGGTELELAVELVSPAPGGVSPAEVLYVPHSSDGWFPEGADVSVEARARTGFSFLGWTGDLAGRPNPAAVSLSVPYRAGAEFDLTYRVPAPASPVEIPAARTREVVLEVENANLPVRWERVAGSLPAGLSLDPAGVISGAALETGSFPLELRVTDGIGLAATSGLTLTVVEPAFPVESLVAPFLLAAGGPDPVEESYLDLSGNRDGTYDLGDLRAYLLRNPELPMAASLERGPARILVPLLDLSEEGGR